MSAQLPPALEPLLARLASTSPRDLPLLRPTKPYDASLTPHIEDYCSQTKNSKSCVRIALHLINDDIERAHPLAQHDEGEITSDLCHAILHRREGQYWNARLWYDLIKHPLIQEVHGDTSKAKLFIDEIEATVADYKGISITGKAGDVDSLKRKQAQELTALVRFAIQGE